MSVDSAPGRRYHSAMPRTAIHALAACLVTLCTYAQHPTPPGTPESQGVQSPAILAFVEAVENEVDAVHSFVLMRHGRIVSEGWWAPYRADAPHMLYSLSKSFTSTAIGMAVDEGKLSLDDTVVSFFPDQLPESPSEHLRAMRVRDLLCMGTGHQDDTFPALRGSNEPDWIERFLAQSVQHKPGTFFRYNTGATYMCSAILQKVTGEKLIDYLRPRLFRPLGIHEPAWETSPEGINTGGYGLKVRTRDIARLGQLYLQKGLWNGRRLLSEVWVEQATAVQIDNGNNGKSDWSQGYGFQFWRCRHNAYRGDGAFGQYCIVMPDQDAVLAITSGLGGMQKVLDLVWEHLLPGMHEDALPAAPAAVAELRRKTASLQLSPVEGLADSPRVADTLDAVYQFPENDKGLQSISLHSDPEGFALVIENAHGQQRIPCGHSKWVPGTLTFEKDRVQTLQQAHGRQPVAASGAWVHPNRYVAAVYFVETPFRLDLTLQFKDEQLFLSLKYNVQFGKKQWQLKGTKKN